MKKTVQGAFLAVTFVVLGAALATSVHLLKPHEAPDNSAKIIGPTQLDYAGQYATYHVAVPGKDPAKLIFTWSVEPVCPGTSGPATPSVHATMKPGEAQLDTVAGRWRLSAAIADPVTRTGHVVTLEVNVPHESPGPGPVNPLPPVPQPTPVPGPLPLPGPPAPLPPAPDPGTRFAQFTSDVAQWLAAVQSPDKSTETAQIASGAAQVAESLRSGTLSKLTGMSLRIAVASEVLANNNKIANKAAWSAFGRNVNAAAAAAVKANQLNTPDDWAAFLTAFEKGLKQ